VRSEISASRWKMSMRVSIERRIRDVPADFPRPDDAVTRRFEARLLARLKRKRLRRQGGRMTTIAPLVAGAILGAGLIAVAAGAGTERVTLTIRPTIVLGTEFGSATVFGSVSSRRAGEHVQLERQECGQSAFRVNSGPAFNGETSADGTFGGGAWFKVNTAVRARWLDKDITSEVVDVKRRPTVQLRQRGARRLEVVVWGVGYFEGKRVRVERWNGQRWIVIKWAALKRGIAGTDAVGSEAELRAPFARGTRLRAVFPGDQARPCYIEGVSRNFVAR
jgi:hypothetical protein